MNEEQVIKETNKLNTKESLINDLKKYGINKGTTVLMHSSLSSIGWVCGGAVTVVKALMETVTEEGTIIMPAFTPGNSDPSAWSNPPVPEEWWPTIRETMPAYDPKTTPTRGMGKIAETFRQFPSVIRSEHPAYSFAAWGKEAKEIINGHRLDYPLGDGSPLAKIYELRGRVLLLGVDYDNNTSFHLAEYFVSETESIERGAAMLENGERIWKKYSDIELNADVFKQIGKHFEKNQQVLQGKIGSARIKYFKQNKAVDFAKAWLKNKASLI